MLHVACLILPGGAEQQMTAYLLGVRVHQCGHVLKLVAEANGPARLIQSGTRPKTRHAHLIRQVAVQRQRQFFGGHMTGQQT